MAYSLALQANFGPSNAGLATVGLTILNADGTTNTARSTSGVVDLGGGAYGRVVSLADGFRGWAKWDTGTGSPLYAVAPIEPIAAAVWGAPRSAFNAAGTTGELWQLATATVVASGSTTSTVRLASPWNAGQASGRTLYLNNRGYQLGTSAGDTYPISPNWTVPADGTTVVIGILAASTPAAVANVAADVTGVKAKTDALPASWPTNFSALAITPVTGQVSINMAQTGLVPRDISSTADAQLTVCDALVSAVAIAAGDRDITNGNTFRVFTPAGTRIASKTLNDQTNPTSLT